MNPQENGRAHDRQPLLRVGMFGLAVLASACGVGRTVDANALPEDTKLPTNAHVLTPGQMCELVQYVRQLPPNPGQTATTATTPLPSDTC